MKKKIVSLVGICVLLFAMTACGGKESSTTPTPTKAVEATTTPTQPVEPTAEPTATPTPKPTVTPTPMVTDTYQPGTVTEDSFTSEWMGLRFTRQEGLELGTGEGIEMYATSADGVRVEVYTEPVPEEYLAMPELDYLSVLMENLMDADYKILDQSNDFGGTIGNEYYAGIAMKIEDSAGLKSYVHYVIRKKEARMIVIALTSPNSEQAYNNMLNLLRCFNGYSDEPVVLPEGSFAGNVFQEGVFTENGYENEWMNVRINLPEEATLIKSDTASEDAVFFDAYLGDAAIQFYIFYFGSLNISSAEEYLLQSINYFRIQEQIVTLETEGGLVSYSEETEDSELGGQEYSKGFLEISTPDDITACIDFYGRIKDNYMLFITLMYEKGNEELDMLLRSFSTY